MTSHDIRARFLAFFKARGHAIIPSASLIPENDPTVLFNTAGMQPLVPYLMGNPHPMGDKLADVQKCVRTGDIDDIGDSTHATFFEMLGNWSLGNYFKKEAITWSYEFLTSKEEGLGLDPNRLCVTVFEGNDTVPRDTESAEIWKSLGIPEERIFYKGVDANWWPAVKGADTWTGPTGPCSEMFYDTRADLAVTAPIRTPQDFDKADAEQRVVEVWNDVFMEYEKKSGVIVGKLSQKNVDTGAGLERLLVMIQNVPTIFDTDVFVPIMNVTRTLATTEKSQRIIADHIRTAIFLIADGVLPSNTDRGYVLRRLLRRAIFHTAGKNLSRENINTLIQAVLSVYGNTYPNIQEKAPHIEQTIIEETEKFQKTILEGVKKFENIYERFSKLNSINLINETDGVRENVNRGIEHIDQVATSSFLLSGQEAFLLFSSYGFPIEMTMELAKERGMVVDIPAFYTEMEKHQALSRAGAEQKFKGGLADTSEMSVKYHTATHLLNAALHQVLGDHVQQKGSNITPERLRFDFSHPQAMTPDQKKEVEAIVNKHIAAALPVSVAEMTLEQAREMGAIGVFGEKYPETVTVYTVGDPQGSISAGTIASREICGGPHVKNTSELGTFKIVKEEAVSAGVRRIKAVLE